MATLTSYKDQQSSSLPTEEPKPLFFDEPLAKDEILSAKDAKPSFNIGDYFAAFFGGPQVGATLRQRKTDELLRPIINEYGTKINKAIATADFDTAEKLNTQLASIPYLNDQIKKLLEANVSRVNDARGKYTSNNALIDLLEKTPNLTETDKKALPILRKNAAIIPTTEFAKEIERRYPNIAMSKELGATAQSKVTGEVTSQRPVKQFATLENTPKPLVDAAIKLGYDPNQLINLYNRVNSDDDSITRGEMKQLSQAMAQITKQAGFAQSQNAIGMPNIISGGMSPQQQTELTTAPGLNTGTQQPPQPSQVPRQPTVQGRQQSRSQSPVGTSNGLVYPEIRMNMLNKDGTGTVARGKTQQELAQDIARKYKEGYTPVGETFTAKSSDPLEVPKAEISQEPYNPAARVREQQIASEAEGTRQKTIAQQKAEKEAGQAPASQSYWRFNKSNGEIEMAPVGASVDELKGYARSGQPQKEEELSAYTNLRSSGKEYLKNIASLPDKDKDPDFLKYYSDAVRRTLTTGVRVPILNTYVGKFGTQAMSQAQAELFTSAVLFADSIEPYLRKSKAANSYIEGVKNSFTSSFNDPSRAADSARQVMSLAEDRMRKDTERFPGAVYEGKGSREEVPKRAETNVFRPTKESVLLPKNFSTVEEMEAIGKEKRLLPPILDTIGKDLIAPFQRKRGPIDNKALKGLKE